MVDYGDKIWHNSEDQVHREDGPAIEKSNGDKWWYQNNKRHRIDGPAVENADGDRAWWVDGFLHREDGPAVILSDGTREYYFKNEPIECSSDEEYITLLKLRAFW